MRPMISFKVSDRRNAFRTKINPEGLPSGPLESLLEQAARFVQTQSGGRWIINRKAEFVASSKDTPVELSVIVPAGNDQYTQYLEAVKLFEAYVVATFPLVQPIDTTLSIIESDGPKCAICHTEPKWVRAIRVPGFSCSTHFCAVHAPEQEDFRYSGPSTFFWHQLSPSPFLDERR